MGGVVDSVFDTVGDVVDSVVDVVEDVVDGVGDVLGDVGELAVDVVSSPVGQIAMYAVPGLREVAPYITASAKVASGQDLTLLDVATLGFQAYSDISTANWVDPDVALRVKTAAAIADGADPAQVLLANYGSNWVNEMGITDTFQEGLADVLSPDTFDFVSQNIDFDQVTRDLVTGTSPERMLANQFGETVVNNISSGDPQLEALGKAGITSAVALAEGKSPESALVAGGRQYYKAGGELPDLGAIADSINLPDVNFNTAGLDFLADIGKDIYDAIPEFSLPELNTNLGIDFGSLEGFDVGKLSLGDFEGMSLPDIQNFGIDVRQLQGFEKIPTALALAGAQQPSGTTVNIGGDDDTDYGASLLDREYFDNELLNGGTPLSRKLLNTKYA